MKWFLVFMVLLGDILIVKRKSLGFVIWIFVDGIFSFYNFQSSDYAQSVVFLLYSLVGVYGFYTWNEV
jgi:hypothetical protein